MSGFTPPRGDGQAAPQLDPVARAIRIACLLDAAAPKPGNVHHGAAFGDMTAADLVTSAEVITPLLVTAGTRGVGRSILDAVQATRRQVGSNTNLGIILLLAPLAAVEPGSPLAGGIDDVLDSLGPNDADDVFAAIALANPAGLGRLEQHDVAEPARIGLVEAMRLAAERDLVARQYATGFELVLGDGREQLASGEAFAADWSRQVVGLALWLLARHPDSLITRKCGPTVAREAGDRAAAVLAAGWPDSTRAHDALRQLDSWLRADGHRRNPGTTADLVTAILFAAIRDGQISPPPIDQLGR